MGFPLICRRAVNMRLELSAEILKSQIFLGLLLGFNAGLGLFNLDLVDDVLCAAVFALQVRPP